MGKLDKVASKRAAARKAKKAEVDAATAADATAAAATAIAATYTAVAPAAPSGYGIGTRRSYAAAVADGTAVAVVTTPNRPAKQLTSSPSFLRGNT